jgi:membrane protein DedA with SNARE-associated domain
MHGLLHGLIATWFHWVEHWGYWGVFILMAMESSIIPVPSEIVVPPAAFWAAQGRMTFAGVVLAGTAGSYLGSALSYWGARWLGLPLLKRYGRYARVTQSHLELGERWVKDYGIAGVLVARLLPVVRHLISMPAGLFRMPFARFSIVTILGAGFWCFTLAWFGREVIGDQPGLLSSPDAMIAVIKARLQWFVLAVVVLGGLYALVVRFKNAKELQ